MARDIEKLSAEKLPRSSEILKRFLLAADHNFFARLGKFLDNIMIVGICDRLRSVEGIEQRFAKSAVASPTFERLSTVTKKIPIAANER